MNPPTTTSRPDAALSEGRFVLAAPPVETVAAPTLTDGQQRVVEHGVGPLLVLAGPGTGKTTALVEAAVARIRSGTPAEQVLVLTFGRRAAGELRRQISARLGRTTATPLAFTVHGFCLALLRRFGDTEVYGSTLRLLSGPEQELRLRETLSGTEQQSWPAFLEPAWPTHGFAAEVRAVLARTRQWGMDPTDLVEAGMAADRAEWVRLGEFFDEYLDVLDAEQVLDYAELVHRCRILLADPEVADRVHREIGAIYVDEYQDTDPSQVELIAALATPATPVVAAGDPDQSIFGFRGSQARGILDFCHRFRTPAGDPAPIVTLPESLRTPKAIMAATRRIAARLPLPRALPAEVVAGFRDPVPVSGPSQVEVHTCDTVGAEADHVADLLRRAHLHDGLAWSEMAVLVRSGRRSIPSLSRALTAAGVPVEVAGDEIPLAAELAVRPLLLALQVAADGRRPDRDQAARLLLSPLGGLDSMGLRRLGRTLRAAERSQLAGAALPRPSDDLVRAALVDPEVLADCPDTVEVRRARTLAELLVRVEAMIAERATASEALWALWSATGWPRRLREQSLARGESAGRADRDLDAVNALFAIAARSEELSGHRGVTSFLAEVAAQQIPADTLTEAGVRGGGVRVLTAHRSKGLSWPLVVVASVQEGLWPDLRSRDTLLGADRLTPYGVVEAEPVAARIAEERRLFYVACTRAERRLVVSAVAGTEGEGDQPSRFVTELGVAPQEIGGRVGSRLTLPGLVGELRRVSVDPEEPTALRRAAAERLAALADATDDDGLPLVPQADPKSWWGLLDHTTGTDPVGPEPIVMSGSQLGAILACPRSWFLARRARAERARGAAASFGSCLHVLIEHATTTGADPFEMVAHLDQVWDQINFEAVWLSGAERAAAAAALERFANWHTARSGHTVLGVEQTFATTVEVAGESIMINGTIDRLEQDQLGRIHVIDFKTGRSTPRAADVATMEQLGLYQLAVAQGALDCVPAGAPLAGAELVYLRHDAPRRTGVARSFAQASFVEQPWPDGAPEEGDQQPGVTSWVHDQLARAARIIRAEAWDARVNDGCRYCPFAGSCPAQSRGKQVVS
ncbi:ATP-dependent helicase [Propionibacteriaceae bacterium Y2011]|uniref:ATP-dependent helicase n=1 Tax=Microlunatus sp. Y2014 TaxID=3418488 RepID=UPI003B4F13B5